MVQLKQRNILMYETDSSDITSY